MENAKTSMILPREILKQAKIRAIEERISFAELVRRALKEYLDRKEPKKERKRLSI